MIVNLNNLPLNVIYNQEDLKTKIPILFLHGFTGSVKDWDFIDGNIPKEYSTIFIDLIGHGISASPQEVEYYSENSQIDLIDNLLEFLGVKKLVIVGYSMGGRLALTYSLSYPEKIIGLVLESTSYGIKDIKERNERIKSDEQLGNYIENNGIKDFIDYWMSIPLFETFSKIKPSKILELKERKISSNNIIGLKNSLVGFSPGRMKYFGNFLNELNTKVLILTGELDQKYCKIAKIMSKKLTNSDLKIVNECGHNVHFEKREEFLKFLNTFLLNIRDEK